VAGQEPGVTARTAMDQTFGSESAIGSANAKAAIRSERQRGGCARARTHSDSDSATNATRWDCIVAAASKLTQTSPSALFDSKVRWKTAMAKNISGCAKMPESRPYQ